jgi:hypothetical protein
MTNNEIKTVRGKDGKVVAGQVTKTFRKRANIFGTPEYEKWQNFIAQNLKAKMVVIKSKKTQPKSEKKIRPTYEKMINFINTQDNAEKYLEEMQKIKNMAAINGNSYNTVVKWFNNAFEDTADYKLIFKGILEKNPEATKITSIKKSNDSAAA